MLLGLCIASWQPSTFLLEVLVEMSHGDVRVLANVLMSLLNLRQDRFSNPLDIPSLMSSHLGIKMPTRTDYLAGGKFASQSFYRDVHTSAMLVLAAGHRYLAVRNHLQVVYHGPGAIMASVQAKGEEGENSKDELERRARIAVRLADAAGHALDFAAPASNGSNGKASASHDFERVAGLYEEAFAGACEAGHGSSYYHAS